MRPDLKRSAYGILQMIFLIFFVVILIRLFPIVIRIVASASMNIVRFWWVILGVALITWLIYVLRKRNSG